MSRFYCVVRFYCKESLQVATKLAISHCVPNLYERIFLTLCLKKMKTLLIVVGKTQNKHLSALMDDYLGRIARYLPFEIEVQPDLRNTRGLNAEQQKEREGLSLLTRLHDGDRVILLDERGKEKRSVDFARFIGKSLQGSSRRMVFVIGGPYGFSDAVYRRADEYLSLSQMTFSHQMIRLLFLEQFYRALTIMHGEPYHHETEPSGAMNRK